ncbi:hypothetical protein D5085_11255 [Ectothiorhodospiraceae bacterium BW-2]|nr:hypothetical protein D5085_11255 [Ectothiorhodospiraceae bacterium BW-2]
MVIIENNGKFAMSRLLTLCFMLGLLLLPATRVVAESLQLLVLHWLPTLPLAPLDSGEVVKIAVTPGERVSRGALLLQLNNQVEQQAVSAATAELNRAELQHRAALREHDRIRDLYDRTLISERERELGEVALAEVESARQQAKLNLQQADRALRYRTLRAPFEAMVVRLDSQLGDRFNAATATRSLITVVPATQLRFITARQGSMAPEPRITVRVDGKELEASYAGLVNRSGEESLYHSYTVPWQPGLVAGEEVFLP